MRATVLDPREGTPGDEAQPDDGAARPRGGAPPTPPARDAEPPADLVRRARAGDEMAFAGLVRALRHRIYRWALVRTGDPDDAEDVTQDVVLKMRGALDGFDGRARLSTWLYAIVRTTAADLHRRRARRAEVTEAAVRELSTEASAGLVSRAAELDERRLVELVLAFFGELPERQRVVFDLCELRGMTSPEVAALLDIEPVSVRASLLKARRTLRARILETHPELVRER